jgi:hypothetical protein
LLPDEPGRQPTSVEFPTVEELEKINNFVWEIEAEEVSVGYQHFYEDETADNSVECLCLN